MERDFMGLRVKVKQEIPEEILDPVPLRGQTMQWSFSNKGGSVPQFLSFESSKEEKPKTGFEALVSTGLVTITTAEALDSCINPYSSIMQKNMVLEKQGVTQHMVTTYPPRPFDAHSIHRPHEARGLRLPTQTSPTVSMSMSTSIHQSFISPAGQSRISSTNPQHLSVATPVPVKISTSPVVGTTELRSTSKASGAPAQLTIFYAGSVCVYEDVSPEKAQAIMLLAGNGPPLASSPAIPAAPVPVSTVRPSHTTTPCLLSPIFVGCSVTANDHVSAVRSLGTLKSPPNKVEPSKNVSSAEYASARLVPSGVPQFRKASLARFLEKRKERVLSASPYAPKQSQDCSTPGSASRSLSANSSGSLLPLSATN